MLSRGSERTSRAVRATVQTSQGRVAPGRVLQLLTIRVRRPGVKWGMVCEHLRRIFRVFASAGFVLFALASGPAAADLYRWVDAKGVVNYSNVPPQGVKAKQIAETQPTVSVIPLPERPPEVQQARREAELLRRIEQLEDELAALRRASTTVVYAYPPPVTAPVETIAAPIVFPFHPWPVFKPGKGHRFWPRQPGAGADRGHGGRPPVAAPITGRPGLTVRARF